MKQGKTIMELAAELDRQSKNKRDFVAPATELLMTSADSDGRNLLEIKGQAAFDIADSFHEQLGSELEIPAKYYKKCLADSPQLLRSNVNHWLQKSPAKRMVRTLDNRARAFLSDKYRPLDNYDLAEVALPVLSSSNCRIESCEITESRMYIKAVTEKIQFELKKGDVDQAGIVISNSEIGKGSLKIEPLLFRLVCLNGMISNDRTLQKYHVGRGGRYDVEGAIEFYRDETRLADDKAFWLKVRDTLNVAFNQIDFEKMALRFAAASENQITKEPQRVIELAQKRFSLSEIEGVSVLGHLMAGGDMNQFGLANAITRAAQDVKSYDRATELERLGGEIIELPRSDWNTLSQAAIN